MPDDINQSRPEEPIMPFQHSSKVTSSLLVTLVCVSLLGNIILTAFMYNAWSREITLIHQVQNAQEAQKQQVHAEKIARCQQGNTFRSQDLELWTKVLTLSATHHTQSPQEARTAAEFQAFLVRHDAQTDCSRL